ncbi:MAG: TlpA family protein disulfide reductase [Lysinibacillus sp.]
MKKRLLGIVILTFAAVVAWNWSGAHRPMEESDFTLPTLEGTERSLHDEQGKVVILNFWASWCRPSEAEMPHFQNIYDQYKDDVEILAVNFTSKDKVEQVKRFVKEHGLTFPILLDEEGKIGSLFRAMSLPTTVIIDRAGKVQHELMGPLDEETLLEHITPLL